MMQYPEGGRMVLLYALPAEDGTILRAGTLGRARLLNNGSGGAWFTVWTGQRALVSTADLRVFIPELGNEGEGEAG